MALFTTRSRTDGPGGNGEPEAAAVPETGHGVETTWWCAVGSIVLFSALISLVVTLSMLDGGDPGLQLIDVAGILLAAAALGALTRYCWFFRKGLGGGLPEQRYTLWLLLPPAAIWAIGLLQPHTLWSAALPLWFAANALSIVVGRRARWWVLGTGLAVLTLHGPLGILLGRSLDGASLDPGLFVGVGINALATPVFYMAGIWWWEIVVRLDNSRHTSGELAVAKERLRFAADLHDIQGHHLQVIALKAELAGRLLDADPEAARTQITEVQQLARTALEETRALVHGYRDISLTSEAANAAEVLRAAGIDCSVEVDADGLPPGEQSLFGLVIREATTNILRHSDARTVAFRLRRSKGDFVLSVANDGVSPGRETRTDGSGIDGLRRRFEAVGGGIEAQRRGAEFELTASAPAHGRAGPAVRENSVHDSAVWEGQL